MTARPPALTAEHVPPTGYPAFATPPPGGMSVHNESAECCDDATIIERGGQAPECCDLGVRAGRRHCPV